MQIKKYILLLLFPLSILELMAVDSTKNLRYENYIYENDIKTVLLFQASSGDQMPVLAMGSGDKLTLSFDQLGNRNEYFQYTFVHCNSNWEPTDLQANQFLDGAMFDNINKFQYSNNTYVKYVNYNLEFPTENMKPKISGNYLLKVFRNFDENDLVLTRRFFILDNKLSIDGTARPATSPNYRFNRQEVDFMVNAKNYLIINPFQDAHVVLIQNYWQDNAIRGLKPLFVNGHELTYNYEEENVFGGINEFRFFDLRSLRFVSPNVQRKVFENGQYTAQLIEDEIRGFKRHISIIDYNGKRVIENKDGSNGNMDGDYAWVQFTLLSENVLPDSVYIMGELCDWRIQEEFKMSYHPGQNAYKGRVLIKQGYYDYIYVTAPKNQGELPETSFTEGNYFDTENDYYIFYYVRNQFLDYHELLGFKRINTNTER